MRTSSRLLLLSFFIFGDDFSKFMDIFNYDIPRDQKVRERKYPKTYMKNNQIYDLRAEVRDIGISRKRM